MSTRLVQAFKDALAAMNDEGAHWTQGTLRDDPVGPDEMPRYCSLGAVYLVTNADLDRILDSGETAAIESGDLELRKELIAILADAIPEGQIPHGGTFYANPNDPNDEYHRCQWKITTWNDASSREWDDVVAVFERAQEKAEGAPST